MGNFVLMGGPFDLLDERWRSPLGEKHHTYNEDSPLPLQPILPVVKSY